MQLERNEEYIPDVFFFSIHWNSERFFSIKMAEVTFNFRCSLSEAIYREDLKQRREGFLPYYQALPHRQAGS
jgi:hypothetical protein